MCPNFSGLFLAVSPRLYRRFFLGPRRPLYKAPYCFSYYFRNRYRREFPRERFGFGYDFNPYGRFYWCAFYHPDILPF